MEMDEVALPDLRLEAPLRYPEFLNLMTNARLVLTDQGAEEQGGKAPPLLRTPAPGHNCGRTPSAR